MSSLDDKTIKDFEDQITRYHEIDGFFGSLELFDDILSPLMTSKDFEGKVVADIGSGPGRIVSMLLQAGAGRVYAIEPGDGTFEKLLENLESMERSSDVVCINARGDEWNVDEPLDQVISIGVIPFIFDPSDTMKLSYEKLKPGGSVFLWIYSHEGNEMYLTFIEPLRKLTVALPHFLLRVVVEILYGSLHIYRLACKLFPLPLRDYIETVLWPMLPRDRRLVIYDQLNPTHAKYHKRHEALALLEDAGFENIEIHHRHGYSWSIKGTKPG